MKTASVCVLATAMVGVLGCSSSSGSRASDLRAVRAALGLPSAILAPFRPGALGRKSCRIGEGGPVSRRLDATCETRVVRHGPARVVIFTEQWRASDFRASGPGFRQAGGRNRLQTSWIASVTKQNRVAGVKIRGDFPPQFVR